MSTTAGIYWLEGNELKAQPLDPTRAHLWGEAVFVPGTETMSFTTLYPVFSVSTNGAILLQRAQPRQLAWFNREGKMLSMIGRANTYNDMHLSPDGSRAALSIADLSGYRDLWVLDLTRQVQTRITTGNMGYEGVWSPDGSRLAYHTGTFTVLYERNGNGAGTERSCSTGGWTGSSWPCLFAMPEARWSLGRRPRFSESANPREFSRILTMSRQTASAFWYSPPVYRTASH